jgi:hypothetical protein
MKKLNRKNVSLGVCIGFMLLQMALQYRNGFRMNGDFFISISVILLCLYALSENPKPN